MARAASQAGVAGAPALEARASAGGPGDGAGAGDALLDARQQEAVAHDGLGLSGRRRGARALVVLAGPGAGKTRVIIQRLARLVGDGVAPEQLLGVTYTRRAAAQMRARLAERVGPTLADRVQIETFHGLGQKLIRAYGDGRAGATPDRRLANAGIADAAQRRRLLRQIIVEGELFEQHAGRGGAAQLDLAEQRLGLMWDQGVEPALVREAVARRRRWGQRGTLDDGTPLDGVAAAAMRAEADDLEDLATLAEEFDRRCRRLGLLGYADLIRVPVLAARRSGEVGRALSRRWRSIVVDEFQDVNAAQLDLLGVLAPPAGARPEGSEPGEAGPEGDQAGPELCVVGDDDQAIYAFRGSDERAFEKFARRWADHHLVRLETNYRSRGRIVAIGNAIITRAFARFDPGKVLRAGPGAGGDDGPIEVVRLGKFAEDGCVIAAMLAVERAEAARAGREPVAWGRVAVIARGWQDLHRVAASLTSEGVPVALRDVRDADRDEGVLDALAWAALLVRPESSWAAQRLLIPREADAQRLAVVGGWTRAYERQRQRAMWLGEPGPAGEAGAGTAGGAAVGALAGDEPSPFSGEPGDGAGAGEAAGVGAGGAAGEAARVDEHGGFVAFLRAHLAAGGIEPDAITQRFLEVHARLSAVVAGGDSGGVGGRGGGRGRGLPADAALLEIISAADLAAGGRGPGAAELLDARARARRVERLAGLVRLARRRQAHLPPPGDLAAFLDDWSLLPPRERSTLGDELAEGAGDADADAEAEAGAGAGEEADAVQLITAHSSKGLEFDTVFVTRVERSHGFGASPRERDEHLPDDLVDRAGDTRSPRARLLDEERRLFYVACTRAERRLVIVGTRADKPAKLKAGEEPRSLGFIEELLASGAAAERTGMDVVEAAARMGVCPGGMTAAELAAHGMDRPRRRAEVIDRARARAREDLARALDEVEARPGDWSRVEAATRAARDAAGRLAILAAARARVPRPEWARDAGTRDEAERAIPDHERAHEPTHEPAHEPAHEPGWSSVIALIERLDAEASPAGPAAGDGSAGGLAAWSMPAPLTISPTLIAAYERCPRCVFAQRRLGLREPEDAGEDGGGGAVRMKFGEAVHAALQRFVEQAREADADGGPAPGVDALVRLGLEELARALPDAFDGAEALRAQLISQLERAAPMVFAPGADVLELERDLEVEYPLDEHVHTLRVKIDRLDRVERGPGLTPGLRLIDYKTGRATASKLNPAADDLQLGLYLLALRSHAEFAPLVSGAAGEAEVGTAEYWMLADGRRGVIGLEQIDLARVRERVDEAVRGMIAGRWPRKCQQERRPTACGLLGSLTVGGS